mgnify:CR=1 FL=1
MSNIASNWLLGVPTARRTLSSHQVATGMRKSIAGGALGGGGMAGLVADYVYSNPKLKSYYDFSNV